MQNTPVPGEHNGTSIKSMLHLIMFIIRKNKQISIAKYRFPCFMGCIGVLSFK